MVSLVVRMKMQEGKEEQALEQVRTLTKAVDANEPGALIYVYHRLQEEPSEIVILEVYKDDAAFQTHLQTEHMGAFRGKLQELFDLSQVKVERLDWVAGVVRAEVA
jgi:quinol monooxygenase YgiN